MSPAAKKFIQQRVHERHNPELIERVRLARKRVEQAETPLYQRVIEARDEQQERTNRGARW